MTEMVMMKYNAKYFLCKKCQLIQVKNPYWLKEAYRSPISFNDTGIIERNISISKMLTRILPFIIKNSKTAKCLDYAGGYGILTRLMRNNGYDFYWYDEFCSNLFAQDYRSTASNYQIVTAFELMEHLESPINTIQQIFKEYNPEYFIFSTLLYKGTPPKSEWWYYSFESGQHIAFYTFHTLCVIADQLGFNVISNGHNFHIFSKNKLSRLKFRILFGLV